MIECWIYQERATDSLSDWSVKFSFNELLNWFIGEWKKKTIIGEGRRPRFLNRLFRWRSSSMSRASSSSTASPSPQRQRNAATSSVRRTSPVDLNLGDPATTAASTAGAPPSAPVATPVAARDTEELGALRHLAVELHTALRMSEEENLALKGLF